jgi:hypothetical protein
MSEDLTSSISKFSDENLINYRLLARDESNLLLTLVARRFNFDLSKCYVWEGLTAKSVYNYGDDSKVWRETFELLIEQFNRIVYLVVTDDEFYPWDVFELDKEAVPQIILNSRYFEYILFDQNMNEVLFDTHDNSLIFFKSPPKK